MEMRTKLRTEVGKMKKATNLEGAIDCPASFANEVSERLDTKAMRVLVCCVDGLIL